MLPQNLRPIRLSRHIEPFDSDQHIFELKIDGFRALLHIEAGQGQLISRNGNVVQSDSVEANGSLMLLSFSSQSIGGEPRPIAKS